MIGAFLFSNKALSAAQNFIRINLNSDFLSKRVKIYFTVD